MSEPYQSEWTKSNHLVSQKHEKLVVDINKQLGNQLKQPGSSYVSLNKLIISKEFYFVKTNVNLALI